MIPNVCFLIYLFFSSCMWSKILWLSVRAPLCSSSSSRMRTGLFFVPLEDGRARWHANERQQSDPGRPSLRQPALHQDADAFRTHLLWAHGGLLGFTSSKMRTEGPRKKDCWENTYPRTSANTQMFTLIVQRQLHLVTTQTYIITGVKAFIYIYTYT